MHSLLFCEPGTFSLSDLKKYHSKPTIKVNDEMYNLIKNNTCLVYRDTENVHNAYLFGKLFALHTYQLVAEHFNDIAQTGFLDYELVKKGVWFKKNFDTDKLWDSYECDWDNNDLKKAVKKNNKSILWIGTTDGGDVGAYLYVHKTDGVIDSIIVDNNFFFGNLDTDSEQESDQDSDQESEESDQESDQDSDQDSEESDQESDQDSEGSE